MSFEVETPTETQAKVHIRVTKEDLDHAVDHELGHLKERVKLPGFRPGKIPKQVLQKKYGDALRNDVAKRLLQKAYADALAERKLHPVDPPTMRDEDLKPREDGSLQVDLDFEVVPHIEPTDYDRFTITPPPIELKEQDVEKEIEGLRRQAADAAEIPDGQTLDGDVVVADLLFQFLDGSALPKFENRIIDTANSLVDGVKCEGVAGKFIGCSRGSKVKVTMQLPQEFPLEEHRGKTAVVECTVKDIRRVTLPDVDSPAFLAKLGVKDGDELHGKVRERILQMLHQQQERTIEDLCVDQLLDRHHFPIPEGFLQRSIEAERERMRKDMLGRGLSVTDVERQLLEIDGRMRQQVEHRIRESYVLDRIAEKEQTQVTEEDLERQFVLMARMWQVDAQKLFEHFESQGWVGRVAEDIRRAKVRAQLRGAAGKAERDEQKTPSKP